MNSSMESAALYVIVALVPVLHGIDETIGFSSMTMATAFGLAVAFAGWKLVSRPGSPVSTQTTA